MFKSPYTVFAFFSNVPLMDGDLYGKVSDWEVIFILFSIFLNNVIDVVFY